MDSAYSAGVLGRPLVNSAIGTFIGVLFGATLLLPSVLLGETGFERFEKALSRIASFGSLS